MTPSFDKIHNSFKYNGHHFSQEEFKEVAYSLIKEGEPYEKITGDFFIDWLNNKDHIFVNTSGSTGKPKRIKLLKQAMVNSAIATGDFFGLIPGNTIMNCLPSHYIAGKMMLVRAMVLGLEVDCVAPTSNPKWNTYKHYDFSAMVPLQLSNVIEYTTNIKTIIIGGSSISKPLLKRIKTAESTFYETYGMTETVTHIALKQLQSKHHKAKMFFKALPNVSFKKDERHCLVINAPEVSETKLITNDIVALKSKTKFKWLGRFDNVINSGGVKLFPEQIEEKLQNIIDSRFIIASKPDEKLGEQLIIIVENTSIDRQKLLQEIMTCGTLSKFEIPKAVYTINAFVETTNGKIQRKKTIDSIL